MAARKIKMQKQSSFKDDGGKLYLVPTPIGNLSDITIRAKEILQEVDLVAAEDTRNSGKLLELLGISNRFVSFHEFNAKAKAPELIQRILDEGISIAQISDAGMPVISDPGYELVQEAIRQNVPVVSLPGPAAFTTALIASGLSAQPFTYYGFLPRKKTKQLEFFESIAKRPETGIFYEAPHRIKATLANIVEGLGEYRQVVIARELTKIHEEYLRGSAAELVEYFETTPPKGEMVVLLAGLTEEELPEVDLDDLVEQVDELVAAGTSKKDAIKQLAKANNINKNELYEYYHQQ